MQLFRCEETTILLDRLSPTPVLRKHGTVRINTALKAKKMRSLNAGLAHMTVFNMSFVRVRF